MLFLALSGLVAWMIIAAFVFFKAWGWASNQVWKLYDRSVEPKKTKKS